MLDSVPLFTSWKDSFAGVNRLLLEILVRVARLLSNQDLYAGLRACRNRYNAMMSPEVWSDIDLDQVCDAQIFLTRSKGAPVDIEITDSPKEIQLSILSVCSSRIRSLDISSYAVRECFLTRTTHTQSENHPQSASSYILAAPLCILYMKPSIAQDARTLRHIF